jgi:hypothetical protein
VFYPLRNGQKIPDTKEKFDELAYYAERFDTVEVNNTFYRPPAVKTARSSGTNFEAVMRAKFPAYQEVKKKGKDEGVDSKPFLARYAADNLKKDKSDLL